MQNEIILKAEKLGLNFSGRNLFCDLSFEIRAGESLCLSSPSGKGKTSLMGCVMGFVPGFKGNINVCGLELNKHNISAIRKKIAWLPQNFSLQGRLTVRDALMLPFSYAANSRLKPSKEKLVDELARLDLESSILNNNFSQISGGEKQRIGLIICKLLKRPLLLLDEPTSALDKSSKLRLIDYLIKSGDSALLSASHDEDWVAACSKTIEINGDCPNE